jgi:hypothetical protein
MKIKTIFITSCLALICASSFADTRVWTLTNGKTIEAELLSVIGGKVALKTLRGKLIKLPEGQFVEDDMLYIELQMPPKLDLTFAKKSKIRTFPDTNSNELPRSQYYDFSARIKQLSTRPYKHDLTVEFFVIAEEKYGDKHILIEYNKETLRLEEGSGSQFMISSRTIELMEFVINGVLRGQTYAGYLIMVTDSRGEVIAHKTKKEEWFNQVENLRKVPVGKYFDRECNRAWPTRPKRFY